MASEELIHLVTGKSSTDHVSSANAGALNAGMVGAGSYALKFGSNLTANMTTANSITIGTGCVLHNGRQFEIEEPKTLTVQSGSQGQKRNDLVVARYKLNQDGTESGSLVVIKGAATSGTPIDPAYNTGSILDGATVSDMPLYRIELNGISVGTPIKLFDFLVPQKEAWDSVSPLFITVPVAVTISGIPGREGASKEVTIGVPQGYKPVAVAGWDNSTYEVSATRLRVTDNTLRIAVFNGWASALSATFNVLVLCARTASIAP